MKKVFLCHTTKDKRFVKRLDRDLQANGVSVWLDEREIKVGRSLKKAIEKALEAVDYVVVILSKEALKRPWVERELAAALALEIEKRREIILPVLKEKISPVPLFLRDKKYADASRDYPRALGELLKAIDPELSELQQRLETIRGRIILDIVRRDGSLARFTKYSQHRCLEGEVGSYVEALAADGTISNLSVIPGKIGKVWEESGVTYVSIVFPKPLRAKQKLQKTFSCLFRNSFIGPHHTWVVRQHYSTLYYDMIVRFPKSRQPKRYGVHERRGPDQVNVDTGLSYLVHGGKPSIRFAIRRPRLNSSYVLWWDW